MFTLHNGDCLQYMRSLPSGSVRAIITDPPYGIKRDKGFGGSHPFGGGDGKSIDRVQYHGNWDDERPSKEVFDEMQRVAKTVIIFGGNFFADLLPFLNKTTLIGLIEEEKQNEQNEQSGDQATTEEGV